MWGYGGGLRLLDCGRIREEVEGSLVGGCCDGEGKCLLWKRPAQEIKSPHRPAGRD